MVIGTWLRRVFLHLAEAGVFTLGCAWHLAEADVFRVIQQKPS